MKNMNIKRLLCQLCILAFLWPFAQCFADTGSAGKDFYLAFPPNYKKELGANVTLTLFISSKTDTSGTIDIADPVVNLHRTFTVKANQVTAILVNGNAQLMPEDANSLHGIHVTAKDDVTVYALSQGSYTADAYLGLPVDALGLEYFALGYSQTLGTSPSLLLMVGAYDNTVVTVTPNTALVGHAAGVPFSITLNKGQTRLLTGSDVTGTHVRASAPVAVIAGTDGGYIPLNHPGTGDSTMEMMPPVSTWGKSFLTVPLATRTKGDFFRILASEDNTTVTINGVIKATLARGKFFETNLNARSRIVTSAPALVSQYSATMGFDSAPNGDPFAMLIPPAEQFLDSYTFSTPVSSLFPTHFVNIVVPTGSLPNLRLDGGAISTGTFAAIGDTGFSGGQVPISSGAHSIVSIDQVPFGIHVYGFGQYMSYGYPGGMSFKAINPAGDAYLPNLRSVVQGDLQIITATDSEDENANGILDAGEDINANGSIDRRGEDLNGNGKLDSGEDLNGNGLLDRDTGILKVELLPGADNVKLEVPLFVPGALSVQFSVRRVDLTRPGMGMLRVEDGAGNKRDVPVAIATVAVMKNLRVVATLATPGIEIDLSSFKKPPYSITSVDGTQLVEWRLDTFAANSNMDLGFDVLLKNPVGGERRIVTHKLDLYYTGGDGQTVHSALGERAVEVAASSFSFAVTTDKASYHDGEIASIVSTGRNIGAAVATASVRLSVRDGAGVLVKDLGVSASQPMAPGVSLNFAGTGFSTTGVHAGNYLLIAELLDAQGRVLARATKPFSIDVVSGSLVKALIRTDKMSYGPSDNVLLSARVSNLATNQSLNDLLVVTTVRNSDSTVRMTRSEALPQLPAMGNKEFFYSVPLALAMPGNQTATLTVTQGAEGPALDQATVSYSVLSTADSGAGLRGTLTLPPGPLVAGQSLRLDLSVTNIGNAPVPAMPLTLNIVDPQTEQVVKEFTFSNDLGIGKTFSSFATWKLPADAEATYVAILSTSISGKKLVLDQSTIAVARIDIMQSVIRQGRVLVLLSCDGSPEDSAADSKSLPCLAQRRATIEEALISQGVDHMIVSDETAFARALRSGSFNTFWLTGKLDKLHDTLAAELREATFAGAGLMVDGPHDERNHILDAALGAKFQGQYPDSGMFVDLHAPVFGKLRMPSTGKAVKLSLNGATETAAFANAKNAGPAAVTYSFGNGHSLVFAFDLPDAIQTETGWKAVLMTGVKTLLPPVPDVQTTGSQIVLRTSVTSRDHALSADLVTALPAGATSLTATPSATMDPASNELGWRLELASSRPADVVHALRLPASPGKMNIVSKARIALTGDDGVFGEPAKLELVVNSAEDYVASALHDLNALPIADKSESNTRDRVVLRVREAMSSYSHDTVGGYELAIESFLAAIDELSKMPGAKTVAVRLKLDGAIADAQLRWFKVSQGRSE